MYDLQLCEPRGKNHGLNTLQGKGVFLNHLKEEENGSLLSLRAERNGSEHPNCLEKLDVIGRGLLSLKRG